MSAKKFINDAVDVVEEMLQGVLSVHSDLVRLEGHTVVLHRNIETIKQSRVVLLSGGGSGHEPAHAGFIGEGMLSGAILGGVFASPAISAILAGIRAAAGPMGVLLVVKNYTGDRINFGQAAILAQAEGIKVATVIVADDCALPEGKGVTGGRGVAGTVFVHKIAGAVAASGGSLEEVVVAAKEAAETVKTLGVAMTTCTVPGTTPSERLDKNTIEIGLGIHGEPGTRQSPWQPANALAEEMVGVTLGRMRVAPKKVALLVNNLGGTPCMEIYVMVTACKKALEKRGIAAERVVVGPLMTSLEMQGVSVSLLPLDGPGTLARLESPTSAPAWPAVATTAPAPAPLPAPPAPAAAAAASAGAAASGGGAQTGGGPGNGQLVLKALRAACGALSRAEAELTQWDQVAGDGDCGITFQRGAQAVLADCTAYELSNPLRTCSSIADSISRSMGGTSGALLEIFFRSASLSHREEPGNWAAAFCAGVKAVHEIGGAEQGYRTMLDALLPAASILAADSAEWTKAVEAAEAGAESTKAMDALAGRSNYVNSELLKTVPDPGAKAAAYALRAAFDESCA